MSKTLSVPCTLVQLKPISQHFDYIINRYIDIVDVISSDAMYIQCTMYDVHDVQYTMCNV